MLTNDLIAAYGPFGAVVIAFGFIVLKAWTSRPPPKAKDGPKIGLTDADKLWLRDQFDKMSADVERLFR